MRLTSLIVPILFVVFLTSTAGARPFFAGPGISSGGFVAHHSDRLDLDEGTRAAIEEIVVASRDGGEALRSQIRQAHQELRGLLRAEAPDEEAVMHKAEAIGLLETQAMKYRLHKMLEIRALLTPTQRAELERIHEEGPFRRFEAVRKACAGQESPSCQDADGPRRYFCMRDHAEELSDACNEALESLPRHPRRKGRHGRPPDREF